MNGLLQNMPKQAVCDRLITETTLISPRHTLSHPSQRGAGAGHRSCTPVGLEGSDALDGECELQKRHIPRPLCLSQAVLHTGGWQQLARAALPPELS